MDASLTNDCFKDDNMTSHATPFSCVIDAQAELGECPRWDERAGLLYWADIVAPAIHVFDPASDERRTYAVAEHIGCFSLAEEGGFVAGMRSGVWLLSAQGEQLRCLAANPEVQSRSRFNDGRCDGKGRFWGSTLDQEKPNSRAHLYRFDKGCLAPLVDGIRTGNGLAFSPDQRWLYFSDTPRYRIYRYAFDIDTGDIGAGGVWMQFEEGPGLGRPDGAAVDAEGYYWSTLFDGGRIVRISPDGRVVAEYQLPVQWPTMCAFGGPDLKTLYVTSSRENRTPAELAKNPQSGNVFAMAVDTPGLPEPRFRVPEI
jgi:sugar lactone lactonase YvrE